MIHRAINEEVIRHRLSVNVRALRNSALLTLKKSSERAEMHWRHWQKVEAGQVNITLQTLVRIADVLCIDPADLLREPAQGLPAKTPSNANAPHAEAPHAEAPCAAAPGAAAREEKAPGAEEPRTDALSVEVRPHEH